MPATAPRSPTRRAQLRHPRPRGIRRTTRIPKGETVIEYRGQRTSWDDAMERPDSDPRTIRRTPSCSNWTMAASSTGVRGNAARWINHSCAPNCETYEDEDGRAASRPARRSSQALSSPTRHTTSCRWDGKSHQGRARALRMPLRDGECCGSLLSKPKKKKKKDKAKKKDKKGKSKK